MQRGTLASAICSEYGYVGDPRLFNLIQLKMRTVRVCNFKEPGRRSRFLSGVHGSIYYMYSCAVFLQISWARSELLD